MFKIILIGDIRVGKTSLRHQYMGQGFRGTYSATLGVDYSVKETKYGKTLIYDLAGDPASKILRQQYYNGTQGCLMVYSIVNRKSFDHLDYWKEEITSILDPTFPIFILGNKDDLRDSVDDPVSEEEGYLYSKKIQEELNTSVSYLTTSALTGYNVEVAFNKLLTEITTIM